MTDLREQLQHCLRGRVCLMGLGNVDYGDDGFGVYLAESIAARLTRGGQVSLARQVISAGMMPERYIGYVTAKDFDQLVFLDAVEWSGAPGSVLLLNVEELTARFPQISTHKMSLGLLAKLINGGKRTKVWLLGVQPDSLNSERGLTTTMQTTVELLSELVCEILISMKETGDQVPYSSPDMIEPTALNGQDA
ncbi:MAG: hydrogenase maturation protease [Nitrospirae bacterium]|nr:hydrogenase maturation protease [Nitrospirota bacterium]